MWESAQEMGVSLLSDREPDVLAFKMCEGYYPQFSREFNGVDASEVMEGIPGVLLVDSFPAATICLGELSSQVLHEAFGEMLHHQVEVGSVGTLYHWRSLTVLLTSAQLLLPQS